MKIKTFLFLFCIYALPILSQPKVFSEVERSETKRDYRNHLNLPAYDPSLMPLKTVRTGTGVWTELNPKVPRVDYLGIHFINKDTGWACGANGAIIKTTNGGKKWRWIENNITVVLKAVGSFDGETVIIAGDNGTVLLSTDLGETWQTLNLNTTVNFWNVEFINENLGWLVGENGGCYKTTDGGYSWQTVSTPLGSLPHWDVDFLNENYGFICSDGGKVIRTTNGGNSWQLLQAGDDYALYTIAIADSLNISAGGAMVKFVHSSDGGNNWTQSGLAGDPYVNKIVFVNDSLGYAAGMLTFPYRTTNQGRSWFAIGQNIGQWDITFTEGGVGYSVGNNITITKTTNSGFGWTQTIINDNFYDVHFVNETKGFAISGAFYQTTDGGINWERNYNGPGGYVITFTDSLTGFIGTSQSKIFRTTDGGQIWNLANITGIADPTGSIDDIFFLNNRLGWATAWKGAVMKTTDGGTNWIALTNSIAGNAIQFIDSLIGFTITGYFNKTTNGGATWSQYLLPETPSFDLFFKNNNDGWYTGDNYLFHTTNGGQNWVVISNVANVWSGYFGWLSTEKGILTGNYVYETTDSGSSWFEVEEMRNKRINKFFAPSAFLGYAVGNKGFIFRFDDTTFIPVEFIKFLGEYINDKIELEWITATELNNNGFYIQRSTDKINWEEIGFIKGSGTSSNSHHYYFNDDKPLNGKSYYRIKQIDFDGSYKYSEIIEIISATMGINFYLYQNHPNPFNPKTNIKYAVPKTDFVNIALHTILGDKIADLVNEIKPEGIFTINLGANNLASGIYFYRMTTGSGYTSTKKLTIIK